MEVEHLVVLLQKPLSSGNLQVLKILSVIDSCPLLGGKLKKTVTFGTERSVRYSRHFRCLGCPLLGSFTIGMFHYWDAHYWDVSLLGCPLLGCFTIGMPIIGRLHYWDAHY